MNMLKRTKQVVCLLLCTAIMLSMLPKQVFAEETASQGTVEYGVKNPTYANHVATFDCVWFGNYMQSSSEKEPIKWRVLSVDGNKALLIADKNLENKRFNDEWNWSVPWGNCTLREWMNSDFKETAFAENEQAALINHSETGDSVFALSKPEMDAFNAQLTENGFDSLAIDAVWKSSNTDFLAMSLRDAGIAEPNTGWWLRSNGLFNFMAYFINWNGGQDYRNVDEKDENGRTMARPCVYLDLSKTDCWSYAGTVSSDGTVNEVEKEPEIIDGEYFSGKKNGWPFTNSEEGLGVDKTWHHYQFKTWLSKAGLESMISIITARWLLSYLPAIGWGGDCFGMSLASAAVYTDKYDASKLFPNTYGESKTLNQYGYQDIKTNPDVFSFDYYTLDGDEKALDFIEGLHLLQNNTEFNLKYSCFRKNTFDSMIRYCMDPNDKRIILVAFDFQVGAHAVLIDKSKPVIKKPEGYYIPLYDPNYADDSNGFLNNTNEHRYNCNSYLVVEPNSDTFTYRIIDRNGKDILNKYNEINPTLNREGFLGKSRIKCFDVTNVEDKFFDDLNEALFKETLLRTMFIHAKSFKMMNDMNEAIIAYIRNGQLENYDSNLCDLDYYYGASDEEYISPYILRMNNYNNKDIVIESGAFFLMENNVTYGINVDGIVELKLDTENSAIWFKSLQNESTVNVNLQSELSEDYKTIDVKTILDNNEELTIQNKEGTLTIDAPEGKRGDVQLDNAGDIVNKENILLKELNGYKIGDKQKEDENHGSEIGDGTDKNNKNDEKSSGSGKNATINLASKAVTNNKNASPDTGDHQNMIFWIVAFAGSLIFMGSSIKKLRKKKRS